MKWAKDNLIDYPWRNERTAYKVLISELMLIRTKAKQVEPIFIEFIEQFPQLKDFFRITIKDAEKFIGSLGLLFRAKIMHHLASQIQFEFDGNIPKDIDHLKSLKGIGDYSANAILCFGFGEKRALIDSNFIRVYKRIFKIKSKTKTPKTDKFLWDFAESMLPNNHFIDFNYAILDIGGNICLPRKPDCKSCPLTRECLYYKSMDCN